MRRLIWLALLLVPLSLSADLSWQGCQLIGDVEFLLLRPGRCNLQYVIDDPRPFSPPVATTGPSTSTAQDSPQGSYIDCAKNSYEPAFRLGIGITDACQCSDLMLTYTRFYLRHTDTFRPSTGGLWAISLINTDTLLYATQPVFDQLVLFNPSQDASLPGEIPAISTAVVNYDFNTVDITYAWRYALNPRFWTRTFGGLHYVLFEHKFTRTYAGTLFPGVTNTAFFSRAVTGQVRDYSRSWGLGPMIGSEAAFSFYRGFGLHGRAACSLLAGRSWVKQFQAYRAFESGGHQSEVAHRRGEVHTRQHRLVVPGFTGKLGCHYTCSYCASAIVVEAAYEMIAYPGLFLRGPNYRMDRGTNSLDAQPFFLDGLAFSVVVEY